VRRVHLHRKDLVLRRALRRRRSHPAAQGRFRARIVKATNCTSETIKAKSFLLAKNIWLSLRRSIFFSL
jgi:hypothetical protein